MTLGTMGKIQTWTRLRRKNASILAQFGHLSWQLFRPGRGVSWASFLSYPGWNEGKEMGREGREEKRTEVWSLCQV